MTSDVAYQLVQFVTNKAQQGYISPVQFNLVINEAQIGFLNYLLGQFQSYQYGRPVPRVQWGMNEIVRQRITPLIGPASTLTPDSTGFSIYPANFQQGDAMWTPSLQRIRFVPQHKLYSYLNSQIDPINANPIFTIESGGFRFYPNNNYNNTSIGTALLNYVSTPPQIIWNYTTDTNGRPVYTAAGSQGLVWYETDCFEIVTRALKMIGVNLDSVQVGQFANEINTKGQ